MGSGNVYERLFKLWATVAKLVLDGKRDAERVAQALQAIVDEKLFNPSDYFVIRPGLWVSDAFRKYILAAAKSATAPTAKLEKYELPRYMSNAEIRAELGDGHVFEDASVFSATLAKMIDAQWDGKAGALLNNSHTNVFYVRGRNEKGESEVFAVRAYWDAVSQKWDVDAGRLDADLWFAGHRAFSARQ